jgi:hypothetical protein
LTNVDLKSDALPFGHPKELMGFVQSTGQAPPPI